MSSQRKTWVVGGLVLVLLLVMGLRYRALQALRTENAALQATIDAAPRQESGPPVVPSNAPTVLAPDEHLELLRLRSEVQSLRDALRAAPASSAAPRSPLPAPATPSSPGRGGPSLVVQEILASPEFAASTALGQALLRHVRDHGGALPGDWAVLEGDESSAIPPGTAARFESMRTEPVPEEARGHTFVGREKEPRQLEDGRWIRTYLLADGSVALAGPVAQPDWPGWERLHEGMARERSRRAQP